MPDLISVFDSNVWFSAIRFGGTSLHALNLAYATGRILASAYIRAETERTLHSKHNWNPADVRRVMDRFVAGAPDVITTGRLRGACRDPKDDDILECALNANAAFLVTGDMDLLNVTSYPALRILKPRAFLELFPEFLLK